jgi:tetratricopeptide (TPR) repeat protein
MRRMVVPLIPLLCCLAACASGSHGSAEKASAQLKFGVKAAKMNLWREARFRFERAEQMGQATASVKNDLAVAYEGAGDFEKAKLAYAEALKLDPKNTYIQKNYSRFTEFYARSRKRQLGIDPGADATPEKKPPARKEPGKPMTIPPPPTAPIEPGSPTPVLPDGMPPHGGAR